MPQTLLEQGLAILERDKPKPKGEVNLKRCVICDRGIKGGIYCRQHQLELAKANKGERFPAFRYVHYRGNVIGLFKNGDGRYKPHYVGVSIAGIPKAKLIDLDHYEEGFTREQIKKLKACVLKLAQV